MKRRVLTRIFHTLNAGSGDPAYRNRALKTVGRVPSRGRVSAFQAGYEISRLKLAKILKFLLARLEMTI